MPLYPKMCRGSSIYPAIRLTNAIPLQTARTSQYIEYSVNYEPGTDDNTQADDNVFKNIFGTLYLTRITHSGHILPTGIGKENGRDNNREVNTVIKNILGQF